MTYTELSNMETEKLIEKLSQEQNESSKVVRIALAYAEFASLVKRMREAQREFDKIYLEDYDNFMSWAEECDNREREVDEYLKKMEI